MKIRFFTEGGKNIGFGHIHRCLSLGQAFKTFGYDCQFYISGDESVKNLINDFDSLNKTIDERIEGFRSYYFDKGIDDCLISEIGLNTSWQALLYEADKLKSQGQSLHIFVPNSRAYEVSAALKDFTGTTRIVGIDLVEGNRHCLRKGTIDFVIDQNPAYQGSEAIRSFYKLKVAKEPISDLKIPLTIYTAENL